MLVTRVGDTGHQRRTYGYGGGEPAAFDSYRLPADRIAELLERAGFVVTGRTLQEPEAGAKRPVAGFLARKPEAGSREPGAGARKPGAGSRGPGPGSRKPAGRSPPGVVRPAS
ncbi:hypothetical protein ACFWM7_12225 [Streptomyces sp. NPDC058375]|uniref:hypothetical protein n=1 Tax=Streptomyces sp. NPDC058375 TaxID=3346467 RepID=UPI003664EE84